MSETSLEDLLSDKDLHQESETEQETETEEQATGEAEKEAETETEQETEAAETEAKKGDSTPESKASDEPDWDNAPDWVKKAIKDERRKRQEAERRAEETKKEPVEAPDWYADPEKAAQHQQAQIGQMLWQQKVEMGQEMMRSQHDDYDDMEARFVEMAQENPTLKAEFHKAANPARFAYDTAKKAAEYDAMKDVDGYKAKLEAEVRKEVEEKVRKEFEDKAKKQAEKEAAIEPSLASAGNGGLNSSDWSGPTPLDDILK